MGQLLSTADFIFHWVAKQELLFDANCINMATTPSVSQRSLHNAPIFRLLLKVAVNGTHQCDFPNFCGQQCPTESCEEGYIFVLQAFMLQECRGVASLHAAGKSRVENHVFQIN